MEHNSINRLVEQFRVNQSNQFTGKLLIYSKAGQQWAIYFLMGRLIWASGGNHRFRRLFRLLAIHAPHLQLKTLPVPSASASRLWEYSILTSLIRQNQISSGPASQLIHDAMIEVLVEILQEATGFEQSAHTVHRIKKLGNPVAVIRPDLCLQEAQQQWTQWRNAGLMSYSPNLAPILKYPDKLKTQVPFATYQKLSTLLTGDRSLRGLSAHLKIDLLAFSQAILPFVSQGVIALNPIPDWMPPAALKQPKPALSASADDLPPLILGIDDSPAICQKLKKIMNHEGYRFIGVDESFRTLPIMFKHKPDLIFLDLVMPISNGYEVCGKIRQIKLFRDIPIVILSGNDGMVDRVRAKLVGANDFMAKPFSSEKIVSIAQKYLSPAEAGMDSSTQGLPKVSVSNPSQKALPAEQPLTSKPFIPRQTLTS